MLKSSHCRWKFYRVNFSLRSRNEKWSTHISKITARSLQCKYTVQRQQFIMLWWIKNTNNWRHFVHLILLHSGYSNTRWYSPMPFLLLFATFFFLSFVSRSLHLPSIYTQRFSPQNALFLLRVLSYLYFFFVHTIFFVLIEQFWSSLIFGSESNGRVSWKNFCNSIFCVSLI